MRRCPFLVIILETWMKPLRKKCPYLELFWSVFFRTCTEYGEIRSISPYLVRIWKGRTRIAPNADTFHAVNRRINVIQYRSFSNNNCQKLYKTHGKFFYKFSNKSFIKINSPSVGKCMSIVISLSKNLKLVIICYKMHTMI